MQYCKNSFDYKMSILGGTFIYSFQAYLIKLTYNIVFVLGVLHNDLLYACKVK